MITIVVATVKEWNIQNYFALKARFGDQFSFHLITSREELTYDCLSALNPVYVFFPHWSWMIPETIYSTFECVVFHMTDLPFGRGGSPMQNLIERGINETKITALRVDGGIDTGDIYMKEPFNIASGSAEANFKALSTIIFETMIPRFLENAPVPEPQHGEAVTFRRRTPEQSEMGSRSFTTLREVYDFIRMLDAEGYPKAYCRIGGITVVFSNAALNDSTLSGRFEVTIDE